MKTYKLYKTPFGKDAAVTVNENGTSTSFLFDEQNPDYIAYLAWLSEGNTPTPADEGTQ
jgi:hypothetical protein